MRGRPRLLLIAGLAGLLLAAAPAPGQDREPELEARYWPRRQLNFPLIAENLARLPEEPTEFRLYVATNRGPFKLGPQIKAGRLPVLPSGKKGIPFEADRDGEYEFAVQFVYPSGSVEPRDDKLQAEMRVVFDTVPPTVSVAAVGNGVEWNAADENLDPDGITLQGRLPGESRWTAVTPRGAGAFAASDRYAWQLKPGQQLDVRLIAKDRAGHESTSRVVRVPGADGSAGLVRNPDPFNREGTGRTSDWPPSGSGGTGGGLGSRSPQAPIYYVNSLNFNVETTINRMGRSGVKAAHLFVSKDQRTWKAAGKKDLDLKADDRDQNISIPYEAADKGLFGFIVIPESGAGRRAPDPVPDAPAMVLVDVDPDPPRVKITSVEVLPGDARGPRVDITYEVADRNLMAKPVSLEWSVAAGSGAQWQPIALQIDGFLPNRADPDVKVGRYSWYVPDEKVWHFFVRIRATDKAANTGESVYEKEVLVDLEKPEAAIKAVQTQPGAGPGTVRPGGVSVPSRRPAAPLEPTRPAIPTPPTVPSDRPEVPPLP